MAGVIQHMHLSGVAHILTLHCAVKARVTGLQCRQSVIAYSRKTCLASQGRRSENLSFREPPGS